MVVNGAWATIEHHLSEHDEVRLQFLHQEKANQYFRRPETFPSPPTANTPASPWNRRLLQQVGVVRQRPVIAVGELLLQVLDNELHRDCKAGGWWDRIARMKMIGAHNGYKASVVRFRIDSPSLKGPLGMMRSAYFLVCWENRTAKGWLVGGARQAAMRVYKASPRLIHHPNIPAM